jgi:adenosine deaminase
MTALLGHGIRAIDDPFWVAHLAEKKIPLEICITSDVLDARGGGASGAAVV